MSTNISDSYQGQPLIDSLAEAYRAGFLDALSGYEYDPVEIKEKIREFLQPEDGHRSDIRQMRLATLESRAKMAAWHKEKERTKK